MASLFGGLVGFSGVSGAGIPRYLCWIQGSAAYAPQQNRQGLTLG